MRFCGTRGRALPATLFLILLWAAGLFAQDAGPTAGIVLSTSVAYNTLRGTLSLSPQQSSAAERLGTEAAAAGRAGKYGDALRLYAEGTAAMRAVAWTPEVELASTLRARLEHAMLEPGQPISLSVFPFYSSPRAAQANLTIEAVLVSDGVQAGTSGLVAQAPYHAGQSFGIQLTAPKGTGDYSVEVRLKPAGQDGPDALRNVFTRSLPVHVESLAGEVATLRARLKKMEKSLAPPVASAQYELLLFERADSGEVNPHRYKFNYELALAEGILDGVDAGIDAFDGRTGDMHKAYKSRVDQTPQPYRLFVPEAYDQTKAFPLVVALHGMGGDENGLFDGATYQGQLQKGAEKLGFIVLAPKGRDPASMYRGTAEQDVFDALEEVRRDYRIDPARMYLMGHSMGGYGTWSVAMAKPEIWAALGPISGGGNAAGMAKLKDIPQYVVHGDNDKTVNVSQSRAMVEAGKKAGAAITYVEVPGGSHTDVAGPAIAKILEFFAGQKKKVGSDGTK